MIRSHEMAFGMSSILEFNEASSFIDILPHDLIVDIFTRMNFKELSLRSSISKRFSELVNDPQILKRVIYQNHIFTPENWAFYFGNDSPGAKDSLQAFKELPENIGEIFKKACPIFLDKKFSQTHFFIWFPPLSLNRFIEIFEKSKLDPLYSIATALPIHKWKDLMTEKPEWIILSKKGITSTPIKNVYEMEEFNEPKIPTVLEATVGIIASIYKLKQTLFNSDGIRCQIEDVFTPVVCSTTTDCHICSTIIHHGKNALTWRFK